MNSTGPTILIVDDEPEIVEVLSSALTTGGYSVRWANSTREALGILDSEPISVVVSDLRMPQMDGIEFLREIRKKKGHQPHFILMSGAMDKAHLLKGIPLGLSDALEKPLILETLLERIDFIVRGSEPGKLNDVPLEALLTRRQAEVLDGVRQGKSNKEIANDLNLSEQAVKYHVGIILKAYGVQNRRDLRRMALSSNSESVQNMS